MSPHAISAAEAIAQGSSWSQMLSVAKFHEKEVERLSVDELNPKRLAKLAPYKLRAIKTAVNASIGRHKASANHFRNIAAKIRFGGTT